MISEVQTFPRFSNFDISMELGPTRLTLEFTWRARTKSWYLDIFEVNGNPLLLGRRLSAYWSPMYGYADLPDIIEGALFVRGIEGAQKDLGKTLILEYYPFQDLRIISGIPANPEAPTVTITSP